MNISSISVHLYVNGAPVNVGTLSKRKGMDFKNALLALLKPANKNQYLEFDIDTHDEYGVLTCTNEVDAPCAIPSSVTSRLNKYIVLAMDSYSEWSGGDRVTILMSVI